MSGRISDARRDDRGFTLIELLVVIIIIGILAAIATPLFLSQRAQAARASLTSDARHGAIQIETADVGGAYPADMTGLNIRLTNGNINRYTVNGATFTYCVEASAASPAHGWSVTYSSLTGMLGAPVQMACT